MKVKVIKKFYDKDNCTTRNIGDIFDITTKERVVELSTKKNKWDMEFVEILKKEKQEDTKVEQDIGNRKAKK